MSRIGPSAAEATGLRFVLDLPGLRSRFLLAAALWLVGLAVVTFAPAAVAPVGILLLLGGHLPLWARTQTLAPGGATPRHEEVWAPVEDDWLARIEALEKRGARWDTTPWDASNLWGALCLLLAASLVGVLALLAGAASPPLFLRLGLAGGALVVPLWFNGIRTTWNPSELRKKGEALAVARAVAETQAAGELDPVPLLALREGRRGRYPVDARLMLRPAADDGSGFLGVQVQVALNNVQGTDYPYLYCVVLGKPGFRLPPSGHPAAWPGWTLRPVYERGEGDGAVYLVIRQHADRSGGWHTAPEQIRELVGRALEEARRARRANLPGASA